MVSRSGHTFGGGEISFGRICRLQKAAEMGLLEKVRFGNIALTPSHGRNFSQDGTRSGGPGFAPVAAASDVFSTGTSALGSAVSSPQWESGGILHL